jgi:glycosyltransferase involved in cell wall biosynthesis
MLKFSVLISVYLKENPEFLRLALSSIINQTVSPDEIVLVKDGPLTAELDELINEFDHTYRGLFKFVILTENKGLGIALAEGVMKASFPIIARMDGDDICEPNRFERELNVLANNSDIDVVGSWIEEFRYEKGDSNKIRRLPEKSEQLLKIAHYKCPLNHMTIMFRKKSVLEAGNYQKFHSLEDYYLWIRMLQKGMRFYTIQDVLVHVRTGNNMYKRRGGYTYLVNELKLYNYMLKSKFISLGQYLTVTPMRLMLRLLPSSLLRLIYNKFLRH